MALTAQRLRELLTYDPASGVMSRVRNIKGRGSRKGQVAGYLCRADGYWMVMIDGKNYRQHRLAFLFMTGAMPTGEIDHINGVRSDNRWENLRDVSHSVNQQNRHGKTKRRKFDLPFGVESSEAHLRDRPKPYCVRINVDGRRKTIGYFASPEEAGAVAIQCRRDFYEGFVE